MHLPKAAASVKSAPGASAVGRYFLAFVSVVVALLIRLALRPSAAEALPFATFFVAVAVSAAFGGRGPAIVAIVSGYLLGIYFFVEPGHQFALEKVAGTHLANLLLYFFVTLTILVLTEQMRNARRLGHIHLQKALEKGHALEQEISRRTLAEESLYEKEWLLRSAVEGAHLGTWVWDPAAGTGVGNDRLYQMLEIPPGAQNPLETGRTRIRSEDIQELERQLTEGLQQGRMELEVPLNLPNGAARWIRLAGEVIQDRQGRPRMAGIAIDISKQKEVSLALQAAVENLAYSKEVLEDRVKVRTVELRNSITELEAFSYSLSHDMRAPLRAIFNFTDGVLVQEGEKLGERGRESLRRVINAARRMDTLIQNVLAFSRISRLDAEIRSVDLDKLISDIIYDRPEMQPPYAEITVEEPLLPVLGDAASLTQCLTNLLGNAVKFVAPGVKPHVSIRTELINGANAITSAGSLESDPRNGPLSPPADLNGKRHVRLWVQDNGIGITKESQEKAFGLFNRVHLNGRYEGSGLGLAIVRKAVERMGGKTGVESELGKGSRFWIELPAGEKETTYQDAQASSDQSLMPREPGLRLVGN